MVKQTEGNQPRKLQGFIVSGEGTDEEIAARCAASVEGWDKMDERPRADLVRLMRQFWERRPAPRMEVLRDDTGRVDGIVPPEGANVTLHALRLSETMASSQQAYTDTRLNDLATYHSRASNSGVTSSDMSASVAFVAGVNATDTVQSSLAVQMAATHDAAMRALGMAGAAQFVEQAKMYGNLATKLLNAYTRQAETLAKLQRGGEQIIKHVHIDNRGGQAVVTDKVVAGGHREESREQPHAPSQFVATLLGHDTQGNGVPITCDQREEAVQAAWGTVAGSA
jgi:hypothetical protein